MATTGEVETLLQCSLKTGIEYVTLCTSHYKELHRTLRADIYDIYDKCSSCNIMLKHTIDKIRHPSNATAINKYYLDRGNEMSYNDESKLCNKCYIIQLDIIRNVEPASEDSMLSTLLQSISEIVPVEKESNSIDHALPEVTSLVGHFLLN